MEAIERLRRDEVLSRLIEKHGEVAVVRSADPFQQQVMMIVEQQVSTESARAVQERLFDRFDVSPDSLLEADREELKSVGLSRQKVDYIRNVAEYFSENSTEWKEMSDQEVVDELTSIKGIGEWTAEMFLIFGLGREDIFSTGDLGLRRAMEELYGIESRQAMREKAEEWSPHRSYASLLLWSWHD
jgi:DNA-3-methyladenine glycosylase II